MADEEPVEDETPKKSKLPFIIGIVLMLLLGGGGFFAVYSGLILAPEVAMEEEEAPKEEMAPVPDVAYVPLDPLVINLKDQNGVGRHLKFRAQVEVPAEYEADVAKLSPRLVDVLNSYLRAVDTSELENPSSLIRIRSHILRRFKVVAGEERVNDLLIMEFVVS